MKLTAFKADHVEIVVLRAYGTCLAN